MKRDLMLLSGFWLCVFGIWVKRIGRLYIEMARFLGVGS